MKITLQRLVHNDKATIGKFLINDMDVAFTCEDEPREKKVKGETRIPAGVYEIKFRTVGGHHAKYLKKYGKKHHGMLELQNVPGFQFILIHIGNTEKDTDGCILIGLGVDMVNFTVTNSTKAYEKIYPIIAGALLKGDKVTIEIKDEQ